jgi:hypothetical protein
MAGSKDPAVFVWGHVDGWPFNGRADPGLVRNKTLYIKAGISPDHNPSNIVRI